MDWMEAIDDKSHYFKRYLDLIKDTIESEWKELEIVNKKLKKQIAEGATYPDHYNPLDSIGDMAYEIEEMEQLMYRSYVIGVFVFMESQITRVCERIQKTQKQKFSYKDLSGNGIGRSIKYLESVLNIKFPADQNLKQEFETARMVRNALVHKEGEVTEEGKVKIEQYVSLHPHFLSIKYGAVLITYEYTKSLIKLNENICKEVQNYNKIERDDPFAEK